jgi:hypothetical protein
LRKADSRHFGELAIEVFRTTTVKFTFEGTFEGTFGTS